MSLRLVHRQPLRGRLLSRGNHVDAVIGAQAVVGHPEQGVRVGRKVEPDDIRLLVGDEVGEAGILVAEAVVVLPPYM